METLNAVDQIINLLPEISNQHQRDSKTYKFLEGVAGECINQNFKETSATPRPFGPFGNIQFPYVEMGAITSTDLFGLDELIIFSFYQANKGRYKKTLDVGANIGLHSIVMSRCGFEVTAFEPDPKHLELLQRNLDLNGCDPVKVMQGAVSNKSGEAEFTRVEGNTTGSHLSGAKERPYGELSKFKVPVFNITDFVKNADFMKLDVEGHEIVVLSAIDEGEWQHLDAMVEIGTTKNAEEVWDLFKNTSINLFSQKNGWKKVSNIKDVPTSYKEGSLFISAKPGMPW